METEYAREMKTTLVLGDTGKTGRRMAKRLERRGVSVWVGSRSGEPAFDWEDEASWAPAMRDFASVYVSYYPDLAVPGAAEAVRSFSQLALERGVGRLVLLSGRGEEISRATGREIRYVPVSVEEFASALDRDGVPPEVTQLLTYLFTEVLDGRNAYLTDGLRGASGRERRDFSDYARDSAATGVWYSTR
jgi:uncharacterized protein YbjT (DUF2867 family)